MSMSTNIYGIRPPDEKWQKMKAAWDACKLAGIKQPEEVLVFFDDEPPDESGVVIDLSEWVETPDADCIDRYEINLAELPKDLKSIRIDVSY